MKAAIVGLQGSGRKTLMAALCGGDASAAPAGRKSVATLRVPDDRIARLSAAFRPRKTTYATVEAALDDTPCDSLGKRLAAVRGSEVLVLVAGAFGLGAETGAQAALEDLDKITSEMILADQMVLEKRLESYRKIGDKGLERRVLERLCAALEEGAFLRTVSLDEGEERLAQPYSFLTLKPVLAVINVDEDELENPLWADIEDRLRKRAVEPVVLAASLEREVAVLAPEEQVEFLQSVGLDAPVSHRLVQSVYRAMDLVSFFTVGEDEVRSWPVRKRSPAPIAAGRIHSDIRRGFIRAEVVSYAHFMEAGSLAAARKTGRLRTEGKDYIVKDGDIINFLFNV